MNNINFLDVDHKATYIEYIDRAKIHDDDVERKSLFYLLALNSDIRKNINSLYNFEKNKIEFKGLDEGWQTGSSKAITKLAFNLYNGFDGEYCNENEELEKIDLNPLNIFSRVDNNLVPYLFNAIILRLL